MPDDNWPLTEPEGWWDDNSIPYWFDELIWSIYSSLPGADAQGFSADSFYDQFSDYFPEYSTDQADLLEEMMNTQHTQIAAELALWYSNQTESISSDQDLKDLQLEQRLQALYTDVMYTRESLALESDSDRLDTINTMSTIRDNAARTGLSGGGLYELAQQTLLEFANSQAINSRDSYWQTQDYLDDNQQSWIENNLYDAIQVLQIENAYDLNYEQQQNQIAIDQLELEQDQYELFDEWQASQIDKISLLYRANAALMPDTYSADEYCNDNPTDYACICNESLGGNPDQPGCYDCNQPGSEVYPECMTPAEMCTSLGNTINEDGECEEVTETPDCDPETHVYNVNTNECDPIETGCAEGEAAEWNEGTGNYDCIPAGCPEGQVEDPDSGVCVDQVPECDPETDPDCPGYEPPCDPETDPDCEGYVEACDPATDPDCPGYEPPCDHECEDGSIVCSEDECEPCDFVCENGEIVCFEDECQECDHVCPDGSIVCSEDECEECDHVCPDGSIACSEDECEEPECDIVCDPETQELNEESCECITLEIPLTCADDMGNPVDCDSPDCVSGPCVETTCDHECEDGSIVCSADECVPCDYVCPNNDVVCDESECGDHCPEGTEYDGWMCVAICDPETDPDCEGYVEPCDPVTDPECPGYEPPCDYECEDGSIVCDASECEPCDFECEDGSIVCNQSECEPCDYECEDGSVVCDASQCEPCDFECPNGDTVCFEDECEPCDFECPDGSIVCNEIECPECDFECPDGSIACSEGECPECDHMCPDGSIVCSEDECPEEPECPEGTTDIDGVCVSDEIPIVECDIGEMEVDGACVADPNYVDCSDDNCNSPNCEGEDCGINGIIDQLDENGLTLEDLENFYCWAMTDAIGGDGWCTTWLEDNGLIADWASGEWTEWLDNVIEDMNASSDENDGLQPWEVVDCEGVAGGNAQPDECGVCNGDGGTVECWNGSTACTAGECDQPYICPDGSEVGFSWECPEESCEDETACNYGDIGPCVFPHACPDGPDTCGECEEGTETPECGIGEEIDPETGLCVEVEVNVNVCQDDLGNDIPCSSPYCVGGGCDSAAVDFLNENGIEWDSFVSWWEDEFGGSYDEMMNMLEGYISGETSYLENAVGDYTVNLTACSTSDCADVECVGGGCTGGQGIVDGVYQDYDSLNDMIYDLLGEEYEEAAHDGSFYQWMNENLYGGDDWGYGEWNAAWNQGSYQGTEVTDLDIAGMVSQFQSDVESGTWDPTEGGGISTGGVQCYNGDCNSIMCQGADCYYNQPGNWNAYTGQPTTQWGIENWNNQMVGHWESIMDDVECFLTGGDNCNGDIYGNVHQETQQFMCGGGQAFYSSVCENLTQAEIGAAHYMYIQGMLIPGSWGGIDSFWTHVMGDAYSPQTPWGGGNSILEAFDDNNDGWGYGTGEGENSLAPWDTSGEWDWDNYGQWGGYDQDGNYLPGMNETPWYDNYNPNADFYEEFTIDVGNNENMNYWDPEIENMGGYNTGDMLWQYDGSGNPTFGSYIDGYGVLWDGDGYQQGGEPGNTWEANFDGMTNGIIESWLEGEYFGEEFENMMEEYYDNGLPEGYHGPPVPDFDWGS